MTAIDWGVLVGTILAIVFYGIWASRRTNTVEAYLRGSGQFGWMTIGLSVMATQASAITFLSTPGKAFEDGMGFIQFYLGLPLATIVVSAVFIPMFYRLEVYTAYEYLEKRFDLRMRLIGAAIFLVSRGIATGFTIYAPAIILSSILGWSLNLLIVVIGTLVIVYTVSGGTTAVSYTQKQQMIVIMLGMILAAGTLVWALPSGVDVDSATAVAGALGRMQFINFELDFQERYNLWSGLIGGFFLQLSYFGTDQSQVQRYIAGRSLVAGRLGLLFNGFVKIPMQAFILYVGILLFVFHIFVRGPVFFDDVRWSQVDEGRRTEIEEAFDEAFVVRKSAALAYVQARKQRQDVGFFAERLQVAQGEVQRVREQAKALISSSGVADNDGDYIFVQFVLSTLPRGLVGLLIAVILSAAMSSTASELNALGTTTMVDVFKRLGWVGGSEARMLLVSKGLTAFWGVAAIAFAAFASLFDNLIEVVNLLGSIFYGPVLGIFIVAFFLKRVKGRSVFVGTLIGQLMVFVLLGMGQLSYLWFNVAGCLVVVMVAWSVERVLPQPVMSSEAG
ncbi:MAG: sodium:solute symporter [Myxococcales bacterium]|nr:sodium:solute symporter [Myxococcales bacterium]